MSALSPPVSGGEASSITSMAKRVLIQSMPGASSRPVPPHLVLPTAPCPASSTDSSLDSPRLQEEPCRLRLKLCQPHQPCLSRELFHLPLWRKKLLVPPTWTEKFRIASEADTVPPSDTSPPTLDRDWGSRRVGRGPCTMPGGVH